MKGLSEFILIVERIEYPGFTFKISQRQGEIFLQIVCLNGVDNETGKPKEWVGRKWRLSRHMTNSEVVQTAFKAILTALEHEARELFRYRGVPVLHGHYDLEQMATLMQNNVLITDRRSQ